jgi:cob(I)alamin adenosyltransferase
MSEKDRKQSQAHHKSIKKGLVIVHTGHGKGKSTAAIGTLLRAWGQGLRPCVIQFIKNEGGRWGEARAAEQLGIEWHTLGDGFTWKSKDMAETIATAQRAWALAQAKIAHGEYDLVILDEFTYALAYGWLDVAAVVSWLQEYKPPMLHLIITGRDAPSRLVEFADLVTEMVKVKHPLDAGIRAQKGIEF